jgi:hypothetical protein
MRAQKRRKNVVVRNTACYILQLSSKIHKLIEQANSHEDVYDFGAENHNNNNFRLQNKLKFVINNLSEKFAKY